MGEMRTGRRPLLLTRRGICKVPLGAAVNPSPVIVVVSCADGVLPFRTSAWRWYAIVRVAADYVGGTERSVR